MKFFSVNFSHLTLGVKVNWIVFRQKIDFERDKQYKSDASNKYRRHIHHNRSLIIVNGNISEFISGRDASPL